MSKKILLLLFLILNISFLAGCWDINEIERTQFPAYITVDQDKEPETYKFSVQFPVLRKEAPKEVNTLVTKDHSLQGGIDNLQSRTMGWISLGMLRTVIFSRQVAKGGLLKHADGLWRNPLVPGTINFAITKEEAAKLEETEVPTTSNLGDYLENLFKTTSRNSLLPQRTLNDFFIDLKSQGIEPSIPIIKYGNTDVNIVGLAVFKGDKMVSSIQQPEARALLLLKEDYVKGGIALEVNNYMVSYYVQEMESNINPIYEDNNFLFDIELNLEVDVIENTSNKRLIENKTALKNMERHLAAALTKEIQHLFNQLQKYKSDVIGIGKTVKAKYPERFTSEAWSQQFSRANTEINVQVKIRRIGIST